MGVDFGSLKNIASGANVDAAAEFAKSHCGDHVDEIDAAADRAKVFLTGESCGEQPGGRAEDPTRTDTAADHAAGPVESSADHPRDNSPGRHAADAPDVPPAPNKRGGSVTCDVPVRNFHFDEGSADG